MRIILFILSIAVLSGCAGTVPMKPEDRERISTVTINKEIKAVKPTLYSTILIEDVDYTFGDALGPNMVKAPEGASEEEKFLLSNNIDIKKIFKADLLREIQARKIFKVVKGGRSDAIIDISINFYGFALSGEFLKFDKVKPMLNVTVTIKDKTGKQIWAGTEYITNLSGLTESVSNIGLRQNPVVAEKSLRHISKFLAKFLMADLEGRKLDQSELSGVRVEKSELMSSFSRK